MSLDRAQFNLSAVEKMARLQWEGARAHSQLLNEQMDRMHKAVEIERDRTKLRHLKHQYANLERERRRTLSQERSYYAKLKRTRTAVERAGELFLGEAISASKVARAWVGFFYLLRVFHRGPLDVGTVEAQNEYWSPREQKIVRNPLGPIISTLNWARKESYVPRVGYKSYQVLGEFFSSLNDSAQQSFERLSQDLSRAEERLDALRKEGQDFIG